MRSEELKPCPCCGTDNVHVYQANNDKYRTYQVKCRKCGLRICKPTRAEVISAWNRRAEPEERTAKVIKHNYWLGVSLNVVGVQTIGYEWLCENCKERVIDGDDYCSHCGSKLIWGDENDF